MRRFANRLILRFLSALIVSLSALLAFAGPSRTTYQAKIIKPDGTPLESASVNFKFTILDPVGSCILYSENFSAVNMTSTGGVISFALGSGIKTYPVSATTFEEVFSNVTPSLSCDAGGPVSYSPAAADVRKIVMQFHDGSGWQTLPAMSINAVPYAMYANESLKLNGKTDSDFVQTASLPSCAAGEALRFNGAAFSCVTTGGGGSVTSSSVVTALGYTPADGASVTTLTSSLASTDANLTAVSSTVFAVSSTVTSLQNSVTASLAAITSSQWVTSATSISYNAGKVGIGTSNPTSILETSSENENIFFATLYHNSNNPAFIGRKARGTASAPLSVVNNQILAFFGGRGYGATGFSSSSVGGISVVTSENYSDTAMGTKLYFETTSNGTTVRQRRMTIDHNGNVGVDVVNPVTKLEVSGGVRISMESSACGTSFAGTLRYNAGVVEYCNGSAWSAFGVSGAGLQTFNGSSSGTQSFATGTAGTTPAFVTANGVHTLNIPFASVGTTTAGLISYSDYNLFSNKLNATSAAVTTALGFAPATDASMTALSSTVSSLSATTAASFAAITSSQWVSSGSTINYNSGNVGIGTASPDSLLSLSNNVSPAQAPGSTFNGTLLHLTGADSAKARVLIDSFGTGINSSLTGRSARGTASSPTASQSNDVLMGVTAGGYGASQFMAGPSMQFKATENWTDSANGSAIVFSVIANGTSGGAEKMRIDNNGNVGIGTTAPSHLFSLVASSSAVYASSSTTVTAPMLSTDPVIRIQNNNSTLGSAGYLMFDTISGGSTHAATYIASFAESSGSASGAIAFGSRNGSTSYRENMRINAAGNVGIGTSAPNAKLEVVGSSMITRSLTIPEQNIELLPNDANSVIAIRGNSKESLKKTIRFDSVHDGSGSSGGNLGFVFRIGPASSPNEMMRMIESGNLGIGLQTPSALLHLAAGTSATASFKLTSGTLLTSPASGAIEYDGFNLYFTDGTNTRRTISSVDGSGAQTNISAISNSANISLAPTGSVVISSTTASTDADSGALIVKGGLGVAGNINASGSIVTSANVQGVSITATSGTITPYVWGSTVSGGSLTLESTTHASKGKIVLAGTGGNVGIGTNNPTTKLSVNGQIAASLGGTFAPSYSFLGDLTTGFYSSTPGEVRISTTGNDRLWFSPTEVKVGGNLNSLDLGYESKFIIVGSENGPSAGTPFASLGFSNSSNQATQSSAEIAKILISSQDTSANQARMEFQTKNGTTLSTKMMIDKDGLIAIGAVTPTARLHIVSGTSAIAPLRLTSGTLLATPVSGAVEYDGFNLYFTDGTNTRRTIASADGSGTQTNTSAISNSSNISLVPVGSVVVSSTAVSTNSTTGALIVKGGVGVAGDMNVSGTLNVTGNATFNGSIAGNGNVYSGGNNRGFWMDTALNFNYGIWRDISDNVHLRSGGTTERLTIVSATGNVGVGTTTPLTRLDVVGSLYSAAFPINTFVVDNAAMAANIGGGLGFGGYGTAGSSNTIAFGGIRGAKENATNGDYSGYVSLMYRSPASAALLEGLRIASTGNVGIGSTSPNYKLHVVGDGYLANGALGVNMIPHNYASAAVTINGTGYTNSIHTNINGTGESVHVVFRNGNGGVGDIRTNGTAMAFGTNNTEKMRINQNGNIGIGTTSVSAPVHIFRSSTTDGILRLDSNGSTSTPGIDFMFGATRFGYIGPRGTGSSAPTGAGYYVWNDLNNPTIFATNNIERMRIDNAGYVGIGTSAPANILHLRGTGTTGTYPTYGISGGYLRIGESNDAFNMSLDGNSIVVDTNLAVVAASSTGFINFGTSNTERVRINSIGYVGIGTNSPTEKLSVFGTVDAAPGVLSLESNRNDGANVEVGRISGKGSAVESSRISMHRGSGTFNGFLSFSTKALNDGSSPIERMRIDSAGNVGIGTTNPGYSLSVSGTGSMSKLYTTGNNKVNIADPFSGDIVIGSTADGGTRHDSSLTMWNNGSAIRLLSDFTGGVDRLMIVKHDVASSTAGAFITALAGGNSYFSGNVGIGTTAPSDKLHIYDGSLRFGSSTDTNASQGIVKFGSTSFPGAYAGIEGKALGSPDRMELAFTTAYGSAAEAMRISEYGWVGIGTTAPGYTLDVSGTLRVKGQAYTNTGNGSFSILSDVRYKDVHGAYTRGLDSILKTDVIKFSYKKDNPLGSDPSREFVGISAQNLQQTIPEAVESHKLKNKEYLTVNTSPVLWTMLNAIKQLYTLITEQGREIASVTETKADKSEVEYLKNKTNRLESENQAMKAYFCSKDPSAPFCK